MMLAAGHPENPVGWMLVCRELGLLATEIGRLHRARGELDRAREIEIHVRGELERVWRDSRPVGLLRLSWTPSQRPHARRPSRSISVSVSHPTRPLTWKPSSVLATPRVGAGRAAVNRTMRPQRRLSKTRIRCR